jgi:hypothetical protein
MPQKTYPVADALLRIQPNAQFIVKDNDTDEIEMVDWTGPPPTEAEIDAAGAAWQVDQDGKSAEQAQARAELETGPPLQSLPGLAARVQALEILTGLKTYT